MTVYDKNINLRVANICKKKYEQLIIDDCYDKGKIYIVNDPDISADHLKIVNLADGSDEEDAVNIKTLKKHTDEEIKKLKSAQLSCFTRYCTIDLTNDNGLINGIKALCSYTMILDYNTIDFLKQYDVEKFEDIEPVLKYILDEYKIDYEKKDFTKDDIYSYVDKISTKLEFKVYK